MKYCAYCGSKLARGATYCGDCGKQSVQVSLKADQNVTYQNVSETGNLQNLTTSLDDFFLWTLVTLGTYPIYWSWKSWSIIKVTTGDNISPGWRAFFSIFTNFSLFSKARSLLLEEGITANYSPAVLASVVLVISWIFSVSSGVMDSGSGVVLYFIILFAYIALQYNLYKPVVLAMNKYVDCDPGLVDDVTDGGNPWLITLIVLGVISNALIIIGGITSSAGS